MPIVANGDMTKMEEGELFAIETFGSTGNGYVNGAPNCSHYMRKFEAPEQIPLRNPKAKALYAEINNQFGSLAFCRRWIEDKFPRHTGLLKQLTDTGAIEPYPPLDDVPGCYTAQYEHTIFLHPSIKEVLSRGDDF